MVQRPKLFVLVRSLQVFINPNDLAGLIFSEVSSNRKNAFRRFVRMRRHSIHIALVFFHKIVLIFAVTSRIHGCCVACHQISVDHQIIKHHIIDAEQLHNVLKLNIIVFQSFFNVELDRCVWCIICFILSFCWYNLAFLFVGIILPFVICFPQNLARNSS